MQSPTLKVFATLNGLLAGHANTTDYIEQGIVHGDQKDTAEMKGNAAGIMCNTTDRVVLI